MGFFDRKKKKDRTPLPEIDTTAFWRQGQMVRPGTMIILSDTQSFETAAEEGGTEEGLTFTVKRCFKFLVKDHLGEILLYEMERMKPDRETEILWLVAVTVDEEVSLKVYFLPNPEITNRESGLDLFDTEHLLEGQPLNTLEYQEVLHFNPDNKDVDTEVAFVRDDVLSGEVFEDPPSEGMPPVYHGLYAFYVDGDGQTDNPEVLAFEYGGTPSTLLPKEGGTLHLMRGAPIRFEDVTILNS